MNDGRTNAVFVRISHDEHPALIRGLEQCFIDWLQLLSLPQQAVVARLLVSRDHSFVQSKYGFISFCRLFQDLSAHGQLVFLLPRRLTLTLTQEETMPQAIAAAGCS